VLNVGDGDPAQSAGLGRIFRIAHREPRLCALALEAHARWREWEADLGAGTLLGSEGLVVTSPGFADAMRDAGARVEAVDRARIRERIPHLAPGHPWDSGILDPLGGSLRIKRALAALAGRVAGRRETVEAIAPDGTVRTASATYRPDVVVVCAGLGTQALVEPLGLDLGVSLTRHVRLTYAPAPPSACLIAPECYALPLGTTGRWALGMRDADRPYASWSADEAAQWTRAQHAGWVPGVFRGLTPGEEIRCVSLHADWLEHGDGFRAWRAGPVIALGASNAMKFGPLIGDRLARSALEDEGVHPDLAG
jgi:glycine/D-amino acid oxidase-like deaminating enzyme